MIDLHSKCCALLPMGLAALLFGAGCQAGVGDSSHHVTGADMGTSGGGGSGGYPGGGGSGSGTATNGLTLAASATTQSMLGVQTWHIDSIAAPPASSSYTTTVHGRNAGGGDVLTFATTMQTDANGAPVSGSQTTTYQPLTPQAQAVGASTVQAAFQSDEQAFQANPTPAANDGAPIDGTSNGDAWPGCSCHGVREEMDAAAHNWNLAAAGLALATATLTLDSYLCTQGDLHACGVVAGLDLPAFAVALAAMRDAAGEWQKAFGKMYACGDCCASTGCSPDGSITSPINARDPAGSSHCAASICPYSDPNSTTLSCSCSPSYPGIHCPPSPGGTAGCFYQQPPGFPCIPGSGGDATCASGSCNPNGNVCN